MSKEESVKVEDFSFEAVKAVPKLTRGGKPKKLYMDILEHVKKEFERTGQNVVKVTPPKGFELKHKIPTIRKRAKEDYGWTTSMRQGIIYFTKAKK